MPYNPLVLKLSPQQVDEFRRAVHAATAVGALRPAIEQIYADLHVAINARQPKCDASGACCRFEAYGHRLFITAAEMAVFAAATSPAPGPWDGTGCPYQVGGLCSVHPTRPFGCRIYFCDPTAQAWQDAEYEKAHAAIQQLHTDHNLPYLYVEWREALRALNMAEPSEKTSDHRFRLPVAG